MCYSACISNMESHSIRICLAMMEHSADPFYPAVSSLKQCFDRQLFGRSSQYGSKHDTLIRIYNCKIWQFDKGHISNNLNTSLHDTTSIIDYQRGPWIPLLSGIDVAYSTNLTLYTNQTIWWLLFNRQT